jgi:hypothetical protein
MVLMSEITPDMPALVEPLNEAGFPAMHFEPSDGQPFNLVRAVLDPDEEEPLLYLEVVPVAGLEDLHILQFLVALPVEIVPEYSGTLARYLLDLNAESLLAGFGMRADNQLLYFRTMIPQAKGALDTALLVETVWTISYLVDRFLPLIKPVAAGEQNLDEALAALRTHLAAPYDPS